MAVLALIVEVVAEVPGVLDLPLLLLPFFSHLTVHSFLYSLLIKFERELKKGKKIPFV